MKCTDNNCPQFGGAPAFCACAETCQSCDALVPAETLNEAGYCAECACTHPETVWRAGTWYCYDCGAEITEGDEQG